MSDNDTPPTLSEVGVKLQFTDINEGEKGFKRSIILTVESPRISDLQAISGNIINDIDPKLCKPAIDLRPEDQEEKQ